MRISDWSSDVCSSDLGCRNKSGMTGFYSTAAAIWRKASARWLIACLASGSISPKVWLPPSGRKTGSRSEERRVGNGCVISCKDRGLQNHYNTKYHTVYLIQV